MSVSVAASGFSRLSRMPPAEIATRARMAGTRVLDRWRVRIAKPGWERGHLLPALAPALQTTVGPALRSGAWAQAHAVLLGHVRSRPTPFLLTPAHRLRTAAQVASAHPGARADAVARAARIVGGEYDLLGYTGLRFRDAAGGIDWHADPVSGRRAPRAFWGDIAYLDPAVGDHKVIWELNRHQHWLALGRAWWLDGDPAFRTAFVAELESWLRANPPLVGINWASALEVALRALSWLWALHFFADDRPDGDRPADEPPWAVDLLLGLDRQLRHLERNVSWYFSPNTHLLGEGLGLYVCGSVLPELAASARWRALGRRVLLSETTRQVLADGAHAEGSPHYHRYALDFYLLALSVARLQGDAAAADSLAPVVDRMATWLHRIADARGRLPLIGDDDGGELFPIAGARHADARVSLGWAADLLDRPDLRIDPVPEAVTWLTLHPRTRYARSAGEAEGRDASGRAAATAAEASGYVLLRRGGSHVVMDGGTHGFLNGGHAHADALSFVLGVAGEPLLIDPGTATYAMDAEVRDGFRSSRMHNTLVLDGRSQSVPRGPFHWVRTAHARVDRAVLTRAFDYVRGTTDAWTPAIHQRHLMAVDDDTWIVADEVLGTGTHDIATHWHVDPAWEARREGSRVYLAHRGGAHAWIAMPGTHIELFRGDSKAGLGWVAPVYGRVEPTWAVRATRSRAPLPCWMAAAIGVGGPGARLEVTCPEVQAAESSGASLALLCGRGTGTELTLVRGAGTHGMATVALGPADSLTTDARVLHVRLDETGRLTRLCAVDLTSVRLEGRQPFRLTAPRAIEDVSVRVVPGTPPLVESTGGIDDLMFDSDTRRPSGSALPARHAGVPGSRAAAASS